LNSNGFDIAVAAYQFLSAHKTVITEFSSAWHKRYKILKINEKPDIKFNAFHDEYKQTLLQD
jgi:hypothetical protein